MSRESKFHKLIEQQDNKHKEQVWERVKDKIEINTQNETICENGNTVAVNPKFVFISVISAAAVLLCAVILILVFTLKPAESGGPRFCAESDYTFIDTDMTLKEYAEENNLNLLFFDLDKEAYSYSDWVTQLKNTGEIICFTEEIIDEETGYMVKLSVTDNKTRVEYLMNFFTLGNTYEKDGITVNWNYYRDESVAKFEYKSYIYYITLSDPIEADSIFYWVDKLIEG